LAFANARGIQALADFVGGSSGKLRAASGWIDFLDLGSEQKAGNGTDDYGFSALPSGYYSENKLSGEGILAFFGSAKFAENNETCFYTLDLYSYDSAETGNGSVIKGLRISKTCLSRDGVVPTFFRAVRCLK